MQTLLHPGFTCKVIFFLLFFSAPILAQPQYQFTDLDALLGSESGYMKISSIATAVNDKGHVAGYYTLNTTDRELNKNIGFIYRSDSGIEEIVAPDDRSIEINGINNTDQFIGKWVTASGDESYFVHRQAFENLDSFKYASKINDEGDVLGVIDAPRGTLDSSVAVLKSDSTLIDILQNTENCDQAILSDCAEINQIDFDYWQKVSMIDMNNKGQIVFALLKASALDEIDSNEYNIYSFDLEVGVRFLMNKRYTMQVRGAGQLNAVSINNNGTILVSGHNGGDGFHHYSLHLFSVDGTDLTSETTLDEMQPYQLMTYAGFHTINDANTIIGTRASIFSLTDTSLAYLNDQFLYSPYNAESLPDFSSSNAIEDINSSGTLVGSRLIIGYGEYEQSESFAFIFTPINEGNIIE
jgi:hypothetical protein